MLFVCALLFVACVFSLPPSFHQFYGQVSFSNATLVGENVSIKAYVNGSLLEEVVTDASSNYGYAPVFLVEGASAGDTVTFSVNDYFSTNVTYIEEGFSVLNLVYNVSEPLICIDSDGDSYSPSGGNCGAIDCNDQNAGINPGASEVCGDGLDNDCFGGDATCQDDDDDDGGGGGGGGGGSSSAPAAPPLSDPTFDLDITLLSFSVAQGESVTGTFTVTNPTTSSYTVYVSKELDMVSLDVTEFTLSGGQSRTITVSVATDIETVPDLYIDHVKVWTAAEEEDVVVSIDVISPESIFDVKVDIPEDDLNIWPGEILHASFIMQRIVQINEPRDTYVKYIIRDVNNNEILFFEEVRAIQNEDNYVKEFALPEEIQNGQYVLFSQIEYDDGKVASASKWFDVGPKEIATWRWFLIISILGIAILVIIIFLVDYYKSKSVAKTFKDVGQKVGVQKGY